jgi:hypothetical protein
MFVLEKKKLTVFYDSAATVHARIRPQDMACRRAVSIRLEKRTHSCFAKQTPIMKKTPGLMKIDEIGVFCLGDFDLRCVKDPGRWKRFTTEIFSNSGLVCG